MVKKQHFYGGEELKLQSSSKMWYAVINHFLCVAYVLKD